ncbi:hypothetical protein [Desulfobulbus elongatus]|uniref:hypothetical protein n=1 Tax=Desulfobulbus elongatus TaxID=53332 RepID=UPI0004844BAF|nr:hypothetical protein [Desulfobulbus elongatus]
MRFRITKKHDGSVYSIVVSGEIDDDAGWDLLQIAQTMVRMPHCRELVLDLRGAMIDDDVSVFNTDTLVSVFEEGLLHKDSTLVVRFRDDSEIRLCSDQLPLEPAQPYANVRLDEAKLYGKAMKSLEQEAKLLTH